MPMFEVEYLWMPDTSGRSCMEKQVVEAENVQQAFDTVDAYNLAGFPYGTYSIYFIKDENGHALDIRELHLNRITTLNCKINDLCREHNQDRRGIDNLIEYYKTSLGWTLRQAMEYAISLFNNGTIDEIKVMAGDNNDTD